MHTHHNSAAPNQQPDLSFPDIGEFIKEQRGKNQLSRFIRHAQR